MTTPTLHEQAYSQLTAFLNQNWKLPARLYMALHLLAKYRSTLIGNTMIKQYGALVMAGPFAGMQLLGNNAEGCLVPKLLGCYEAELHPVWKQAQESAYEVILNIGCGDGYYAVGLKRLLPTAGVHAYDIDQNARQMCKSMAEANGVNLNLGEKFNGEDFEKFRDKKTLVMCDIEGGEVDLLDPARYPALENMDIVVEMHQTSGGHAVDVVPQRFSGTHAVQVLYAQGRDVALPEMFRDMGHLDQLLAVWEWRITPTPWAIMRKLKT